MPRQAIISQRVVTPEGIRPVAVVFSGGYIESVRQPHEIPARIRSVDYGDLVIGPALVDSHIHINEPGRTEWEGFETATKAASAGGITTLIDMPLNSTPVTIDAASLAEKRLAAVGKCWIDIGFYGGLVPSNAGKIEELVEAGVFGIKAFLCDSGLADFPATTELELNVVMPILAREKIPLLVHAEIVDGHFPQVTDARSFAQFSASRPEHWEANAVRLMLSLAKTYHCPVHIVHLASADPKLIADIKVAKAEELPLTIETCPHYLLFASEEIPDGQPTFKCAPPIRSAANRDGIRQALLDGTIDIIGSDHSPCTPDMKCLDTGNIQEAWGGISGVQFMLPAVWTAMKDNGATIERLFQWLSTAPARRFGLSRKKGAIQAGYDADFVVCDFNESYTPQKSDVVHRSGLSPYVGQQLYGKVRKTYLRGDIIYDDGRFADIPSGALLRR